MGGSKNSYKRENHTDITTEEKATRRTVEPRKQDKAPRNTTQETIDQVLLPQNLRKQENPWISFYHIKQRELCDSPDRDIMRWATEPAAS